ncbi:MAG TPA: GNAT family N-acetyltransferase [Propionibacteriaceae bacterium]|nr:GNAT family N-acetyltransferase [Propionibacteriaceae bacterium]
MSQTPPHAHPSTPPSVRLALPSEAPAVAAIQRRAWLRDPVLAPVAAAVDLEAAASAWERAILAPPMAHYRVLVAVQPAADDPRRQIVCGFSAFGPSDDPDADDDDILVAEFVIDPPAQGLGHDGRLLNAVADTARADGYHRLTWWLASTDDGLRAWLTETGWAPDGAHREISTEDESVRVKQVRLHTGV